MPKKIIKEDWLDNELKKIQHVWMKKGPDGKFLWDKRRKMNWLDKMDVKAGRYDLTDYELQQAMLDYGVGYDLKWYTKDGGYTPQGEKEGLLDVQENKDHEEAETMNRYMNVLSLKKSVNMWEIAKNTAPAGDFDGGEDPEKVKGAKTMTKKTQEKVKINPVEKEYSR